MAAKSRASVVLVLLLMGGLALVRSLVAQPSTDELKIFYIANEGVLLEAGGKKVVIDGMFRHLPGYPRPSDTVRADMENARGAFAAVDLVLATHHHADHFDPGVAGAHLAANPRATFVAARQVAEDLAKGSASHARFAARVLDVTPDFGERRNLRLADLGVSVLRLRHGGTMNTGFLIDFGTAKVLHLGDSDGTMTNFDPFDLQKEGIDFALVPYWYALDEESRRVIREHIAPKQVIFFHIPEDDPDHAGLKRHMVEMGGRAGLRERIRKEFPQAMFLLTPKASPSR